MKMRLARTGIPEPILAGWEKRFGGRLLPLQHRAIEEYRLLEGASLLISAPTSSGKTFCGEMALIRAVQDRQKALFLVPLKAVAEEKYRLFSECYGALGLRIVISTRDHPESDGDIEKGEFDIAVMVYEKFNALLITNFDLMSRVGTVVVDELHMLQDEGRGAQLELALTKLLYSEYRPQLIALSAVVGEAVDLADWLGCRLLLEKSRPVELRRGVVSEGRFYFRCHNSGELGEEAFREREDMVGTLFANVAEMIEDQKQVLIFLKSRHDTMTAAKRFAEYTGLSPEPANEAYFDTRLAGEEDSSLLRNLHTVLARGVAFHNADLTAVQRKAVEEGYRAGLIHVIFATTTLSVGINLPAATVFIEAQKFRQRGRWARPGLEPLSWAEYESMSGRAGRVGLMKESDNSTGRAVLFAASELERSILWEYYVDKQPAPIRSRLSDRDPADIVLDIFSSDLATTSGEAASLLDRSFGSLCNKLSISIKEDLYRVLVEGQFLERRGVNLTATPLGKAVAITGLSVAGARYIIGELSSLEGASDAEILLSLVESPEGRALYLPRYGNLHPRTVREQLLTIVAEEDPLARDLIAMRRELTPREADRLRLAGLLLVWTRGASASSIEDEYHLHPGMMENIARQAGWLLASAASVLRAFDRFSPLPERLDRLAFSARTGLPGSLAGLYDDLGGICYRGEILKLHEKGITETVDLFHKDGAFLGGIVVPGERLERLEERISKIKEATMQNSDLISSNRPALPESIEIDGTPIRERFRVRINGFPIDLTAKSFKYLVRLVWSRLTKENGWLYKEDLEHGFNQARYLYRLRQEIGRDFLPNWPLYENNRSGYYRLAADRRGLRVNLDTLKDFPDYEVQQMVEELSPLLST